MNEITLDYMVKEILLNVKRTVKDQEEALKKLEKLEKMIEEKNNEK
jgi:hypothetical protein